MISISVPINEGETNEDGNSSCICYCSIPSNTENISTQPVRLPLLFMNMFFMTLKVNILDIKLSVILIKTKNFFRICTLYIYVASLMVIYSENVMSGIISLFCLFFINLNGIIQKQVSNLDYSDVNGNNLNETFQNPSISLNVVLYNLVFQIYMLWTSIFVKKKCLYPLVFQGKQQVPFKKVLMNQLLSHIEGS